MRIVVVDNGGQWTHREWRTLRDLGADAEIKPNTAPADVLLGYDGIVLSGGAPRVGLKDALGNCGEVLDEADVPILGICAGEQFMARHFGGQVAPAKVPEFGKTTLIVDKPGTILQGVPRESTVWESHNDEVTEVPDVFEVLASSADCAVQVIEHKDRPMWGFQFHPEVSHTEYGETMFQNFLDACKE